MSIASIDHKVDSYPPLQPLWMLHDETAMDSLPSVHDGKHEAADAMGFFRTWLGKRKKIHNLAHTLRPSH
jgi:hypothetical protein